jgi:hypothetical protein
MASTISKSGQATLEALGEGRRFRRESDLWIAGKLHVPDAVIAELERYNLVARMAGGRLRLTPAGEAWHVRLNATGSPNRLLVERGLVADGVAAGTGGRTYVRSVTVNLGESPLGWLMARGMISERQFAAGERLRADWTLAGLGPRVTMRWDASPTAGRGVPQSRLDPTLAQISARQSFDGAVAHAGSGLSDILWRVICAGEGLATAEGALGWPKRAGKLVLGLALDRVADFYRIG